jgi:hypothetical protein
MAAMNPFVGAPSGTNGTATMAAMATAANNPMAFSNSALNNFFQRSFQQQQQQNGTIGSAAIGGTTSTTAQRGFVWDYQ